ncbi:DASH complex, subunit Spc19 [Mytilinidion resinicola]|uniref:DASH complex subunit SPC19 n=1 Tax=Mytilinidion resinicola TaxID=574789 RepID=A0A6A6Y313_9PEZI|nr:DASH complex, subunit Spc19 [Mytilinidion resinicola]KAF2802913.1 DASH complex, subunit Spc19 [Mytilinidion resinicola]
MTSSLEGCVASLRTSMQLLDSSISILDSGVNDFPRLSKVLQTTRHFELIAEPDLHTAQSTLLSEIRPEVESLLQRVDNHLSKLERREDSLQKKSELNEGRLEGFRPSSRTSHVRKKSFGAAVTGGKGMTALEELKFKQLRQKKERLSYAVDRLELQAKQRARQLRMSMAAPQQLLDD